jgi:hypothetical protein
MSHHDNHDHGPAPGQEIPIEDRVFIKSRYVFAGLIGLGTMIVVSMGLMRAFDLALTDGATRINALETEKQISMIKRAAPLDPDQQAQRRKYDHEQAELLSSYAWINKKDDVARIPIQRAMEIVVKKYGQAE